MTSSSIKKAAQTSPKPPQLRLALLYSLKPMCSTALKRRIERECGSDSFTPSHTNLPAYTLASSHPDVNHRGGGFFS